MIFTKHFTLFPKVVVSSDIKVDQQLSASLNNNPKTDRVTCLVVEKADYMNGGGFEEDKFRKDITERLRPTVIIMKTTNTDVKQALEENTKKNRDCLIHKRLHTPLTNGDVLYEAYNVTLEEPILLTFTVPSETRG